MTHEIIYSKEGEITVPEILDVTTESLWNDNHSSQAVSLRKQFSEAERREELNVVHRCSDSRYILDPIYVGIPTISAGGKKTDNSGMYNDPGTENIIILPHYPCGGLSAREEQAKNKTSEVVEDIAIYVKEEIRHHDPSIQGFREARDVSRLTDKDVFVAVHTQKDGINTAYAVTYRNGVPIFNGGKNPAPLEKFLHRNKIYAALIATEFPKLEEMQQIQNPNLLVVSRNRRSAESEFPNTTRKPGSTFRIFIPMLENKFIDPTDATNVIRQTHYPVSNFTNLTRILIETDSLDTSSWLLNQLQKRVWMKDWTRNPDHQVFIAKSTEGKLIDIDQVSKN